MNYPDGVTSSDIPEASFTDYSQDPKESQEEKDRRIDKLLESYRKAGIKIVDKRSKTINMNTYGKSRAANY